MKLLLLGAFQQSGGTAIVILFLAVTAFSFFKANEKAKEDKCKIYQTGYFGVWALFTVILALFYFFLIFPDYK